MSDQPQNTPEEPEAFPDEHPQRRREYSGAGSTLGLAALIIVVVGVAIWWFELRGDGAGGIDDDGFGIVELADVDNPTDSSPAAERGRAAPNFFLRTLDDGSASLTDFRGNWVLVNFWASWCGPCRTEVPDLQDLVMRHPDRLVVLGVNQQEDRSAAARFADEFDVTYPIVLDRTGEVSQAYRALGLPVTFLVDPEGVVAEAYRGALTDEHLEQIEQEYLAQ